MELIKDKTGRNMDYIEFKDSSDNECSIQVTIDPHEDSIFLGINDPQPRMQLNKMGLYGTGFAPYPLHPDVIVTTRMHLNIEQIKTIIPVLQKFVDKRIL